MNIIDKLRFDLEHNGFTTDQSAEIVSQLIQTTTHCMHNRWHDQIESYPTTLYLGLWCRAKKVALLLILSQDNYQSVQLNLLRFKPFQPTIH